MRIILRNAFRCLLGVSAAGTIAAAPAIAEEVDFARDVQPVFAEHCLECHGPDKAKGGLTLTTREGALAELKSGARAVVPGDLEKSELANQIVTDDLEDRMPPKDKKPLKPAEIEALKKWISEGAEWQVHWAYRSIQRPAVPEGRNSIDAFVLARLEAAGIKPSPEAGRYTLIRRVYYDLLGLPPTPEEADAFVADKAPDAYEKLVDRALASPHFGERWGRHWLDQARYADSDGYEKDRPRPDAWRFRDWVINAVNSDMPFDQFTIEQLAGDLLPDAAGEEKLATAFHRQTLTNTEGGVDQEQFRIEAVFDRTETTGAVWLGLTVGCARCHSHKYDQLSQTEYYRLFAFFNNADETKTKVGSSTEALAEFERKNAVHAARLRLLRDKLTRAQEPLFDKLLDWEKETAARLAAAGKKKAEAQPVAITSVISAGKVPFTKLEDGSWLAGGTQTGKDVYTVAADLPPGLISALRLEVLPDDSLPAKGPGRSTTGNLVLSEIAVKLGDTPVELHSPKADYSQKGWLVADAIDGKPETGWGIGDQVGKAHNATFQFVRPIDAAKTPRITVTLSQQHPKGDQSIGRFRLAAIVGETEESIAPAEVKRLIAIGFEKWTNESRDTIVGWMTKFDPAASAAAAELAAAEAAGPKPPLMDVRVLAQRSQPRETRVLHRGEFLSPTDPVQPGTPAVLPPIAARNGGAPDRLDFARWLVSRDNPLTARVIVNQIWMRFFGEGLVRTAADFGVRGDKPTHPELLDWLACEFMDRGWSRKQFIRMIMNSATYRQRSDARPELNEIDPRNSLLARQNRLRVEGEIVRDLHLEASGLLSEKIGGPSVYPPMPPEIAALSYANNFKWIESKGEDRYRRGMYTFFKRTAPYPDLITFDCPDANVTSIRRTVSDTPLQALTTLNAATFADSSRALAARVLSEPLHDDTERVARGFRLCLSRPPRSGETSTLLGLLGDARACYANYPDEAKALAGDKLPPDTSAQELAAWTATMRIVMNTDEFITRE